MAQFAGGDFRLTVRHKNGDRIASTKPVDYTIYDNVAAPRVAINEPGAGSTDQPESFPTLIHGSVGEYLTVDVLHTAAITLATTSCRVRIGYRIIRRNPRTGQIEHLPGEKLAIGNRITKSTASTTNDPVRGINDNKVSVANEWTAILAFAPAGQGENVRLEGFMEVYVDGA